MALAGAVFLLFCPFLVYGWYNLPAFYPRPLAKMPGPKLAAFTERYGMQYRLIKKKLGLRGRSKSYCTRDMYGKMVSVAEAGKSAGYE